MKELEGYETYGFVAEEYGIRRGGAQLSVFQGKAFAHDWWHDGRDKYTAAILASVLRHLAKRLGFAEVYLHLEDSAWGERASQFWRRHSAKVCEIRRVRV
jgi:hypothetical protein